MTQNISVKQNQKMLKCDKYIKKIQLRCKTKTTEIARTSSESKAGASTKYVYPAIHALHSL